MNKCDLSILNKFGLSGFSLKVIAIVAMFLAHVPYYFPQLVPFTVEMVTRWVPMIFAFFIAEGFYYTRSKKNYAKRLLIMAVVMFIGNFLIANILQFQNLTVAPNNIFLSLGSGLLLIWAIDEFRNVDAKYNNNNNNNNNNNLKNTKFNIGKNKEKIIFILIAIGLFLFSTFFTEGNFIMAVEIILFYLFREDHKKMYLSLTILAIALFIINVPLSENIITNLSLNPDCLFIIGLPLISLYNGKKGYDAQWGKWIFYIFYPAHLWGLALLKFFLFS